MTRSLAGSARVKPLTCAIASIRKNRFSVRNIVAHNVAAPDMARTQLKIAIE